MKVNRIGQKFGRLKVIAAAPSFKRKDGFGTFTMWKCLCKCGKTVTVRANGLVSKVTRSCGCLKKEAPQCVSKGSETGFTRVYSGYRTSAKKRGRKFELTKDQFRVLTKENCHYCNTIPSKIMKSQSARSAYLYNGIDRVDNKNGYVANNCVSCCECCNKAKGTKTYKEFIEWINRLVTHRSKL